MADILEELRWRGLVAHATDEAALAAELAAGPVAYYVGFDPTAPSLHVGHLVQVLTARRLQDAGHRPLALVGGATGLIGDPKASGERAMNSPEVVAGWTQRLRRQIEPFLDFTGPAAARMVDNLEWTAPMSAIELLRDVGRHFSVNRMLDREAVAARLAAGGISYTEFSYVLLQSNDYLQLHRRHGCRLQLGGSDQWGNITAGAELIRRVDAERVHALATPLLTKADGTKFGKTESGAVWLDPELTSPYAFYQFWLAAEDERVGTYLRALTFRGREEVEALEAEAAERPQARAAQRALARDVTTLVHGAEATARAEAASAALFGRGDLRALDARTLADAVAELPVARVGAGEALEVPRLLAAAGVVPSVSAGRRAVAEGGAYVNNDRVSDADAPLDASELLQGRWLVLRRGRRTLGAVEVVPS
ncbi:tyrosine--tRNA ligase [Quadrisphaera sp. DSM 44207]|uniref:tyrosine--tRNA ligase n=1 Tax=Quadrisphaera sp. DSM 44207 TaxID=1881057 RepID=UPI00089078EB|nr:tyrosine--tRNA ligase [Quadrisphaera sp. DSM 44207]SDQ51715.1 tyrosyl-tRNA synthetase [Quadrisphaera sp. DSM 44207]